MAADYQLPAVAASQGRLDSGVCVTQITFSLGSIPTSFGFLPASIPVRVSLKPRIISEGLLMRVKDVHKAALSS